jgi:alkanesulfonate monooxygenase SsuD/methylene tetrahydromethanopterin reductase-like flavin-dependent oxidoreductase (luciferase family)
MYNPLVTLGWIAGWTHRIGLVTSIPLLPLHDPMHLAKGVATLQELSGGRFALGVAAGWHRDEFEFTGVEFEGRGASGDEAIQVMRALWRGEHDFEGGSAGRSTTRPPSRTPHRSGRSGSAAAPTGRSGVRASSAMFGTRRAARAPTTSVGSRRST